MKRSERSLLWRNSLLLGLSFVGATLLGTTLFSLQTPLWMWAILCGCALAIGYAGVTYLLFSSFQTHRFLELLLKDTLHELNIPLSVIRANLQMLRAHEKEPKALERLERIGKASEDLHALYQEMDYHIKREIARETQDSFWLDQIVQKLLEHYHALYPSTPIQTEGLHVRLFSDPFAMQKILSNLLGNALKYNQKDAAVQISFGEGVLCIEDQGIGMSETTLLHIFERYYQANRAKEGYGIGLSLVKAYCDRLGIGLSIQSHEGKGTKVLLELSHLCAKDAIIS